MRYALTNQSKSAESAKKVQSAIKNKNNETVIHYIATCCVDIRDEYNSWEMWEVHFEIQIENLSWKILLIKFIYMLTFICKNQTK